MVLKELKDKELVTLLQQGSKPAFSEMFDRYHLKAYRLALKISKRDEDAEEIVQDTFLNVFKKIDTFQGNSAFSSWLYRITFNTALMKLRKRKKHSSVRLEEQWLNKERHSKITNFFSNADYGKVAVRYELRKRLEDAVSNLPADYRMIFVLRDIDGLSNAAVSELVNSSVPAVKSKLHRARLMLKKALKEYYADYNDETNIMEGKIRVAA